MLPINKPQKSLHGYKYKYEFLKKPNPRPIFENTTYKFYAR